MNKFIVNTFNYLKINDATKYFLSKNPELFEDTNYINKLLEKNCLDSNLEMVIFLNEHNVMSQCTNDLFSDYFYQELFKKMCACSNLEMITWFYNRFNEKINLEDVGYLKNTLENSNLSAIKFIMSKHKYSKQIHEYIFKYSISKLNIQLAGFIYSEKPEINLKILNHTSLYNSIDVRTPNLIYKWLKIIGNNNGYNIQFTTERKLIVTDELNILGEPKLYDTSNISTTNIFTTNMNLVGQETNECVLCLDFTNEVMLNCSHKFCSHCIRNWIRKNRSCPICRNDKNIVGFYI